MSKLLHSIRWRVQAWHGLILLVALSAFCLTAYHFAYDHQLRRVDREIQEDERTLVRSIMESLRKDAPNTDLFEEAARRLREGSVALPAVAAARFETTAYFTLFDPEGRVLLRSSTAPADIPVPTSKSAADDVRMRGSFRELVHAAPRGFASVVGRDISREIAEMRRLAWILAGSGLGVWFLGLLGGWWLAGRAIKPIHTISRAATRIAEGNLSERIDLSGNDSELDQLARLLNDTFERLHASFERQRRFTADASHELRTPVAILIAETQRILKRDRTADEYRDSLRTCGDTAERMRRLIEALLLLARQQAGNDQPVREACDLSAIADDTAAQLRPLAESRGLRLTTRLRPAACLADAAALSILAANLVRNAIQHHRPGASEGFVEIASGYDEGRVFLSVTDNGPGIPAEDQPHVFERFYRVDKARAGDAGHTGLGLAIVRTIVENHGGKITVSSEPGRGSTFVASLPAA